MDKTFKLTEEVVDDIMCAELMEIICYTALDDEYSRGLVVAAGEVLKSYKLPSEWDDIDAMVANRVVL